MYTEAGKYREKFWYFYQKVIYISYYYEHYKTRSTRINNAIIVLLAAFSLAGVSGLWLWEKFPEVWAIAAACIQILSASTFLLPYAEQVWAIGRLQPKLESLINRVDHDWDMIDKRTNEQINDLVHAYSQELSDLEDEYIGSTHLPASNFCKKHAILDRNAFNFERFGIDISKKEEAEDEDQSQH